MDLPTFRPELDAPAKNPFLTTLPIDPDADRDSQPAYAMVRSGPPVPSSEVELAHTAALEVRLSWGDNVLRVLHATPPRSMYVGEDDRPGLGVDFFLPAQRLGVTRMPIVVVDDRGPHLVIPAEARGFLELADGQRTSVEVLRKVAEDCIELRGSKLYPLPDGAKARIELGDMVFAIAAVPAGKPTPHFYTGADRKLLGYWAAALCGVGAFIASMAFFVPPLGLSSDEGVDKDRLYLIQQYLEASAERNRELQPTPDNPGEPGSEAAGQAAGGPEGQAGKTTASQKNRKIAVQGPKDNPDPHLARRQALEEATQFGIISMLTGAASEVVSPFGRDTSLGNDDLSALGNLWGDQIGEATGTGLGLTGAGLGGGYQGDKFGLTHVGTMNSGLGGPGGRGSSIGRPGGRGHQTKAPVLRSPNTTVSGHLPPEVIQRVVRQNYGRFRLCYEQGLMQNPNLEGRVTARFVIDNNGAVSTVGNGGSGLPSSEVVSCVLRAFYGLSFPAPEAGIVRVTYPILFSPG